MKLSYFSLLLLLILIYSCNIKPKKRTIKGDLNYASESFGSDLLSASVYLSGNIKNTQLISELQLTNTGSKAITIQEITVATPEGIRALPEGNVGTFVLAASKDTLLHAKFSPINDQKIYQMTGKQGYFKPAYKISVSYKTEGDEKVRTIDINAKLPDADYNAYIGKYSSPVTAYSFNTKGDFTQKQKAYLETLKLSNQQPFVYISEQEIAITGLNFRMKSYCEHDSLYSEIFIINHSDFPVKIIKDSLDFIYKGEASSYKSNNIGIEKVSGAQENKDMIEKGDRVLIHFKKYFKNSDKQLMLSLKHAFVLSGPKPLFNDNIDLVKVSLH